MKNTWLVVGDSSGARIFSCDPNLDVVHLLETLEHPSSRLKDRDLASDDRGRTRVRDSSGTRGAAIAHGTRPHEVEAEKFAHGLATRLRHGHDLNHFDDLILVAPPQFLGRLREELDDPISARVRATVARNYTHERPEVAVARVRDQIPH